MLPLGTSAVTVGFGLLITMDRRPLDLRGSWVLIPIAYAVVAVPFVVRAVPADVAFHRPPPPGRVRRRSVPHRLGCGGRSTCRSCAGRSWPVPASPSPSQLGEFGATSFLTRVGNETMPIAIARLLGRPRPGQPGPVVRWPPCSWC